MLTLLYHNVLREPLPGTPVAGFQVTLEMFERQVRQLKDKILHPLEVHEQLLKGRKPSGILVTFDDGAAGIIEAGHILANVGKQGVAFVCPDACTRGLWFYRLADALVRASIQTLTWQNHILPLVTLRDRRAAYRTFSTQLFGLEPDHRDAQMAEIITLLDPLDTPSSPGFEVLDVSGLTRAAQTGGLIFANHSWSHGDLSNSSDATVYYEVERAASWLDQSGLPTLSWFAFPRGRYSETAVRIVKDFHPVCFGASYRETCNQVIPRVAINGRDANPFRFAAKTSLEGFLYKYLIGSIQARIRSPQTTNI